jgi:hypothetical protein
MRLELLKKDFTEVHNITTKKMVLQITQNQ